MNPIARLGAACAAAFGLAFCVSVQATNISTKPLKPDILVKPNVIFGMDDSGSMDSEVMITNNDGAFWWDYNAGSGWNSSGVTHYNAVGDSGTQWQKMVYLFPNGTADGERKYPDNDYDHFAIPPTRQFAFLRSSAFNPLYYNPAQTYRPWSPAYVQGQLRTYANATPSAAKSHPVFGTSTFDLGNNRALSQTVNHTFMAMPGMLIPSGAQYCTHNGDGGCSGGWTTATSDLTVPASTKRRMAIQYFPATYYVPATCTVDNITCVRAPNNTTLQRYEIKSGVTFPSGRTYAAELQNFANWFQYYRKRRLMLAGAMGTVMENIGGLRLGAVAFNNRTGVTMYDADATDSALNRLRIAGFFYENNNAGGTPTRETLAHIGSQYTGTTGIVQYACQRNNAFIVTDGFANASAVTPPAYSSSSWGSGAPYQTTYAGSLADIALSYYTNNLKPTMTAGRVPASQADANPNLHMNTYGLTLGVRGTIYQGDGTPVPTTTSAWPEPNQNRNPTAVDDLWHATINGRGQKYIATDAATTAARITDGLNDMMENVGAQSSVAVSSVNLRRGDGKAYLGTYTPRGWSGDVTANTVSPSTGVISTTPLWSASARLLAKTWTTRLIATSVNGAGVAFTAANVGSIINPGGTYGTDADVVNYLRGDRSNENTVPAVFRRRLSLISAVINARPAVSGTDRVVYAASSEGMLHALDADTGEELWAYVPGSALAEIGAQTRRTWSFETYLDGSPQLFTVGTRKILIGGRGAAGAGYFALDVTNPRSITTEADLASKVLWEFPATQGITTAGNVAMGTPVVVQTSAGPIALITQGYSTSTDAAAARDGRVRLWALNALTGSVSRSFSASAAASGTNPGLAHVTGLVQSDGTVRYVYGGDEVGNLWRFDLQTGAILTIAHLAAPITAAPSLVSYQGNTIVLVGTGRLLDLTDFGSPAQRTFYAIKDTGTQLSNPRSTLVARTLTAEVNGERSIDSSGADVDWSTGRGWYLDLPAGQEANTEPAALFGAVVFTTNSATMTDCSTSSFLYVMDILSGRNFTPSDGNTSYAMARIGDFTVSSVMAMGYDGRGTSDFGFTFQRSTTSPTGTSSRVQCSGSACKSDPPIRLPDMRRKNSWRQVQRN